MGRDFIYLWGSHSTGLFLRLQPCSPPGGPSQPGCVAASLRRRAVQRPLSVGKKLEEEERLGSWVVPYQGGGSQQAGSRLWAAVRLRSCPSPWVVLGADRGDPDLFSAPRTQPALTQKLENGKMSK